MDINTVHISGRLTAAATFHEKENRACLMRLRVAINGGFTDAQGEFQERTTYVTVLVRLSRKGKGSWPERAVKGAFVVLMGAIATSSETENKPSELYLSAHASDVLFPFKPRQNAEPDAARASGPQTVETPLRHDHLNFN